MAPTGCGMGAAPHYRAGRSRRQAPPVPPAWAFEMTTAGASMPRGSPVLTQKIRAESLITPPPGPVMARMAPRSETGSRPGVSIRTIEASSPAPRPSPASNAKGPDEASRDRPRPDPTSRASAPPGEGAARSFAPHDQASQAPALPPRQRKSPCEYSPASHGPAHDDGPPGGESRPGVSIRTGGKASPCPLAPPATPKARARVLASRPRPDVTRQLPGVHWEPMPEYRAALEAGQAPALPPRTDDKGPTGPKLGWSCRARFRHGIGPRGLGAGAEYRSARAGKQAPAPSPRQQRKSPGGGARDRPRPDPHMAMAPTGCRMGAAGIIDPHREESNPLPCPARLGLRKRTGGLSVRDCPPVSSVQAAQVAPINSEFRRQSFRRRPRFVDQ
jgi:hypothetical protein